MSGLRTENVEANNWIGLKLPGTFPSGKLGIQTIVVC